MASQPNGNHEQSNPDADLAQAFKDVARGERAASSLEQTLDKLEEKIQELLERAEENQRFIDNENGKGAQSSTTDTPERKNDQTTTKP